LLDAAWILDIDTTVKPLYGKQEGVVVSYNPKKPGRPSHSYHTYLMAGLRLVLGVEVKAGLEERQQGYLFKLKLTKNVKRLIERLFRERDWIDAGQG